MSETNATIAGWFDDPEGAHRLRWWDGERWTDNFADYPAIPDEQPHAASAPLSRKELRAQVGALTHGELDGEHESTHQPRAAHSAYAFEGQSRF